MKKNQFKNLLKKKNDIKNNKDQIWREKKHIEDEIIKNKNLKKWSQTK